MRPAVFLLLLPIFPLAAVQDSEWRCAEGRVEDVRVISGHPLLVQAAGEAVRQWIYQPTLLNGQPVQVLTTVDVNFALDGIAPR